MSIDKNNLYHLPWTHNNNPNGWIEPTTFCQLQCPQCYRGCDRSDHRPAHRNIKEMITEVDNFVRDRNVQTISISGGEPLLYPHLNDLIKYIKNKRLQIMIFTNGILLDRNKLTELKNLGVNQIVLHIDKYQKREGVLNVKDANNLKDKYCTMFRRVRDVSLGFIEPISRDNFIDLQELLDFYKTNSDIISLIDFTISTETYSAEAGKDNHAISQQDVFYKVKEIYGINYCAYISKYSSEDFAWLCGTAVFSGDNFLGSVDKDLVKFVHEDYYRKNNKFVFIGNNFPVTPKSITKFLTNRSLRTITLNYLKLKDKKKINWQVVLIITPPELLAGRFNICSCCPDAMYHNGKLMPSCLSGRQERGLCENYKYYCEDYIK